MPNFLLYLLTFVLQLVWPFLVLGAYTFRKWILCKVLNLVAPFLQRHEFQMTYRHSYGDLGHFTIERVGDVWEVTITRNFIDWRTEQVVRGASQRRTYSTAELVPSDLSQFHRVAYASREIPKADEKTTFIQDVTKVTNMLIDVIASHQPPTPT